MAAFRHLVFERIGGDMGLRYLLSEEVRPDGIGAPHSEHWIGAHSAHRRQLLGATVT